jgi:hypothetical protein
MAGATTAYKGWKSIVKTNDLGITEEKVLVRCSFIEEGLHSPATVYFVHKLGCSLVHEGETRIGTRTQKPKLIVAAACSYMEAHCWYSASGISWYAIQRVRKPSVA